MAKNLFTYLMVIFMAFAMTACGDDKKDDEPSLPSTNTTTKGQELVGTWYEDSSDDAPYILTFNSDNTGSLSFSIGDDSRATLSFSQRFKWTVGTTADGITYCNILTTSGDEILDDGRYTYIVIGNTMSFGNMRFRK